MGDELVGEGAPQTAYAFGGWHPHGSVNNWPALADERRYLERLASDVRAPVAVASR